MKITILDDYQADLSLKESSFASVFHVSSWKRAVTEHVGGKALFFFCKEGDFSWLIPVYQKLPWSTQFRIGGIGYGGPIPLYKTTSPLEEKANIDRLIRILEQHLDQKCTSYATFPWEKWAELPIAKPDFLTFTQIIHLDPNPSYLFEKVLTGNVRTAIRQAERQGVKTRKLDQGELQMAHHLLSLTQTQVKASYITPFSFFQHLALSGEGAECWGAFLEDGRMAAMSVLLYAHESAFHFLHGWDRAFAPPGTNQILIWAMIQRSLQCNLRTFNLGESHSDSLRETKKRWGAKMYPILRGCFQ